MRYFICLSILGVGGEAGGGGQARQFCNGTLLVRFQPELFELASVRVLNFCFKLFVFSVILIVLTSRKGCNVSSKEIIKGF